MLANAFGDTEREPFDVELKFRRYLDLFLGRP